MMLYIENFKERIIFSDNCGTSATVGIVVLESRVRIFLINE